MCSSCSESTPSISTAPSSPASITSTILTSRPRVAICLGDAAGVGPELAAKLLANPSNQAKADIFVMADRCEVEAAAAIAQVEIAFSEKAGPDGVQVMDDGTAPETAIPSGKISKAAGERCMYQLRRAVALANAGQVDAIVFTPLNKTSMHMAGMHEEDELRWFAKELHWDGTTSEINIIKDLWTARVTSHIGVKDVAARINQKSVIAAIDLLNELLYESGIDKPRLGICALNPHAGENGLFGTEEIDSIAPGVKIAQEKGVDIQGPFPCDTIWLSRQKYDGIVTMYHDQGQTAIKLLGFDGGVTVQGGLPVVIATPAHGTAFDIAGKNLAGVGSSQNALDIAITMASRRAAKKALGC